MENQSNEPVAKLSDIPEGQGIAVKVGNEPVALFNEGGAIYALEDSCTHARIPISGGWVENGCAHCPWHGAEFDLKTGEALSRPAVGVLKTYQVRIEGDSIFIDQAESE